jgi:hypothetical protein
MTRTILEIQDTLTLSGKELAESLCLLLSKLELFKPIVLSTQQALNTILWCDIPLLTTPPNLRLGLGPAQPALGALIG